MTAEHRSNLLVEGTITGDSLSGTLTMPDSGTYPLHGKRKPALTTQNTLRELSADEAAKAVVERHMPGLWTHPQIDQALDMNLHQLQMYAPEITNDLIQAIEEDLSKL